MHDDEKRVYNRIAFVRADNVVHVETRLLERIYECQRLGIRLLRLRVKPHEYVALARQADHVFLGLPFVVTSSRTFCGYPIVVNWEKQG